LNQHHDNKGEREMATLHIQHPITDFETWTTAFNRFREARRNAGVQAQRIQRPVDNERYVVIDLDFETVDKAQTFLAFLRNTIWASAANSPGLMGTPEALVLEANQTTVHRCPDSERCRSYASSLPPPEAQLSLQGCEDALGSDLVDLALPRNCDLGSPALPMD